MCFHVGVRSVTIDLPIVLPALTLVCVCRPLYRGLFVADLVRPRFNVEVPARFPTERVCAFMWGCARSPSTCRLFSLHSPWCVYVGLSIVDSLWPISSDPASKAEYLLDFRPRGYVLSCGGALGHHRPADCSPCTHLGVFM